MCSLAKILVYVYMAVVVPSPGSTDEGCVHWNPITKASVGAYVLIQRRNFSDYNSESCLKDPILFLKKNPSSSFQKLKPKVLAKLWLMNHREKWNNTFYGAANTIANFQNGKAINVMVDRDYSVQRFLLINSLTKRRHLEYKTENEAFALFAYNPTWQNFEILECQQFLYFLSGMPTAHRTTFTIIRRNRSVEEDELIRITGGLSGFIKE